jgi:hypothetical protein
MSLKRIRTSVLEVTYGESGPADGAPVLLMHGWPYDVRDYDQVVPLLTAKACRVIVPYLRDFGPTRFLSADTPRSGQQGALGNDLKEFMDARHRARRGRRLRLGRPRSLCRGGAVADARALPGHRQRLQYPKALPARRRQPILSRSTATGTSIISTASAGARVLRRTAAPSSSCSGACGRRTGNLMMRGSNARPRPGIIRISCRHDSVLPAPLRRSARRSRRRGDRAAIGDAAGNQRADDCITRRSRRRAAAGCVCRTGR